MTEVLGRPAAGALLAALLLGPTPAPAAETPALPSLFPLRAELSAPGGRLARLDLPPEVLAACRPDLSDLRIVAGGREVPYLVLEGLAEDEAVEVRAALRPELLSVDRRTEAAATEPGPASGREVRHERFELSPPPPAPAGERWDLVLETGRRELVRRARVASARDGGDDRPLWEGSVFRLAGPAPRERLRVPLPSIPVGDLRPDRLVITMEGEDGEFFEPSFRYERVREIPGAERTRVPLAVEERRSEVGRTVVEVERPRGLVPDRLALATGTPAFDRRVEVWDEGPGAAREPLTPPGGATVYRLPGDEVDPGPERGAIERLEVPLRAPRGDRLRVVIHDGDSPPLAGLELAAAVRRPALLFALPEGGPATLYFGGGRAFRPRYDLEELAPGLPAAGEEAGIAGRLYDPAALPEAGLGEVEDNPRFDPAPALAFAQRPGAALEAGRWEWRRPLEARPSAEGLVRLRLDPADVARARADLADLRIADAEGRQWAYLLEEAAATEPMPLEVAGPRTEDGVSRYELTPPHRPAALEGLTLEVDAPFFDRPFTLIALRDGEERRLAGGRLVLPPRDPRPVEVAFPETRVDRLVLEVEDGSDAPLAIAAAAGRAPLPELYFTAPAGEYALLLGNPDAEAPRYELARVRDVVLAVSAGEAAAGPIQENPAYRPGARWLTGSGLQRTLLWAALLLAVAGLAVLTLRLARREESG